MRTFDHTVSRLFRARISALAALLAIAAGLCGPATASPVDSGGPSFLHVQSGAELEYNDNIFFTRRNQEADLISTGTFGLDTGVKTERLELHFKPSWRFFKYKDNSSLDDHDQFYRASFDYRATPRFSISSEGGYIIDNRRDDQVDETGVVFENVERKRWEATLAGEYMVSEKAALNMFGRYWSDDYEEQQVSSDFNDLEVKGGGLGYTHLMSLFYRPTYFRLNSGYYNYDYDTAETDYYYFTVGASAEINEKYTIIAEAGPRYTDSEFDVARQESIPVPPFSRVVTDKETSSSLGGNGLLSLAYGGEKTTWELALSRDVTASSGDTQTVEQTELRLDWNRRWTRELSTKLLMRYFHKKSNRDNSDIGDIDEDTVVFQPRVRYRFNDEWFVQGSYRYTWEDDNEVNETTDRNQVLIQFGHNWKIFE